MKADSKEQSENLKATRDDRARGQRVNTELTDESLLRLASSGDQDAFGLYFSRKRSRILRLAARISGPGDADDVMQTVFISLWKSLPKMKNLTNIDGWLTKTTINRGIDSLRAMKKRLKLATGSEDMNKRKEHVSLVERGEISKVFSTISDQLGDRQKVAFVLREMEGYSSAETANLMGISASTVRNLVMQARGNLRESLRILFPEYSPAKRNLT